ncbi:hypothetical protein PENTCL1PPCAC_36, partial [Pristionchus entomophagus]
LRMSAFTNAVEWIELINTISGLFLNLLLLYAIRRFSKPHLGAYKQLLTTFTTVDIFLVALHVLVHPRVMRAGYIHATVTDTIFDDVRITALYIGLQSVPFSLLAIHFLYRYWSVCKPLRMPLFSNKLFVLFLASLIAGAVVSWYFLCLLCSKGHDLTIAREVVASEYAVMYGKRIQNAWVLLDNWRDGKIDVTLFVVTCLMDVITVSSIVLTLSFAILTFYHISKSDKLSIQAHTLQRKLLIALCAQASIPTLFVYIPYLICINIPFLKIPGNFFHDTAAPVMTCFPLWDAVIIILLFSDFRRGLAGMMRKL